MYVWMDGWMYGCMDVWMYGCMDVWMYGRMYVCMYVEYLNKAPMTMPDLAAAQV